VKTRAEFVTSAAAAAGFPRDRLRELAMVGRSNVGKSSLINALAGASVARTSAAPGKTRLANFYRFVPDVHPPFYLVDLPGYGYARGGDAARRDFDTLAAEYFGERQSAVLFLVDSRHPDLDADQQAWRWLDRLGVARQLVATKLDKLTQAERRRHLAELERRYSGPAAPVSARTGEGLDELWRMIDRLLRQPPPPRA
jgi:GTP-binding protein